MVDELGPGTAAAATREDVLETDLVFLAVNRVDVRKAVEGVARSLQHE
jgi:hypothetical protein